MANGKTISEKYTGLPNNILNIIKPVYLELCSRDLLQKCLHGKTQNANESFNGTLWRRVPKEVFVWLKTVKMEPMMQQFNSMRIYGLPKGV
ncbi:uncharacterized protein LOC101238613 [Caerostris extrusa]|uniref:Uncharacterized protein LOC101238613, partial n=1 Tax=Caerostris extrusa TaxID=172846 RepID=A0AAV4MFM5_CAEEX|nr:uncharacterized protein LOC101238613 [Caerostris extrusa]